MRRLLAALALMLIAAPAHAQRSPLNTDASHAVIMDYETGLVLFSKDGDEPMHPSSMSKIMTVLMTFEAIDSGSITLETEFVTSEDAWRRGGFATGGSTMCLLPNERVTVADLLRGVIVLSGNDAAIVLAQGLGGSESAFALDMMARAEELGLTSANLVNATGWPDAEHVISARDLAEIARVTIRDHPDLYAIYAEREFDFCDEAPSNRFNRNPVLGIIDGADGLKTGHAEDAGYGLVASRVVGDTRRIVVFNGLETNAARSREAERLLRAAFTDFRVNPAFTAGQTVGALPVYLGESETVPVRIEDEVLVGYHRSSARDASARIVYEAPLRAPIEEGDVLGTFVLEMPGTEAVERPVVAAASVAELDIVGKAAAGFVHIVRTAGDE
jgi:D-alanyl-D-alanine carboxypeptidase (penicillin-binding protein 5/6)